MVIIFWKSIYKTLIRIPNTLHIESSLTVLKLIGGDIVITEEQFMKARENFILASKDFGFEFISPCLLPDDLTS